jgi:cytochrome c
MKSLFMVPVAILALTAVASGQEGDPTAGKSAFARCSSCHDVGANPRNRMGPYLTGVVGRRAASVEGFTYSQAMVSARESGLVWTPETLDAFIHAPHEYVPGTKMPNVTIPDVTARANVIAYLRSVSPEFDAATQVSTYTPPGAAETAASDGSAPAAASSVK